MMDWLRALSVKGVLAFYLVTLAFILVIVWMFRPPSADANALALLAGFVTLFLKMAADASGYQYQSSAGSDKKDDNQAKVTSTLAAAAAPNVPPPEAAPSVVAWWSLLTDAERAAVTNNRSDARVESFITKAQSGRANKEDLTYLVARGLLTQGRADAISTS
jgi:hypothetical protein